MEPTKDQSTTKTKSRKAGVVKSWRKSDFECPECGSIGEVFTTSQSSYYWDGDELECKECGLKGGVQCDEGWAEGVWDW